MNYKVGRIFYLVGAETAKVIPFRIVEEVTRTTMQGIEKSFIAELPNKDNTSIDVSKLKGAIFKDIKSLRQHMIDNASNAIDGMIKNAKAIAEEAFDINENLEKVSENNDNKKTKAENKEPINSEAEVSNEIPEAGTVKVDIGNGVVANMKASDLEKVAQQ